MTKIGVEEVYEHPCFDCIMGLESCKRCPFAPRVHVDPNEIVPDELIPWLRKRNEKVS